jgi:hypothetical protein
VEQAQLEKFKRWFDNYVAGFYGDDEFVNANLKSKEEHSRRVAKEMICLAEELGMSDEQKRTAEVIAFFHDIGRFEQFVRYRTFNDLRSVDHGLLSLKVLRETKILNGLKEAQKRLIEEPIEYHGRKELSGDLDGECLLFSKLIRDADKIDAYYVVTDYYKQYRDDPEGFELEMEFPNEPGYSSEVIEDILCGRRVDQCILWTWNDAKLYQLSWVYDINFAPTLERIRRRRFLEKIFEFLPEDADIEKVREKIFGYVHSRIRQLKKQEVKS